MSNPTYRQPTARDIGKQVEVTRDGKEWLTGVLRSIDWSDCGHSFWTGEQNVRWKFWYGCRIPCTTTADELLVAADLLEEQGLMAAAEVLRQSLAKLPQRRPYFDPLTPIDAAVAKPGNVGTHFYPGCTAGEFYTSDCQYGCGCWMGRSRSGGHDGVDPFGTCPNNRIPTKAEADQ